MFGFRSLGSGLRAQGLRSGVGVTARLREVCK